MKLVSKKILYAIILFSLLGCKGVLELQGNHAKVKTQATKKASATNTTTTTSTSLVMNPATSVTATASNQSILVQWASAGANSSYIVVRRASAAVTWQPTNGNQYSVGSLDSNHAVIYVGTGLSTWDMNLTNGVTYYYSVFAFSSQYVYATAVTMSATPAAPSPAIAAQISGSYSNVTAVGSIVYFAMGSAGIAIYDYSTPASPVLLGSYDTPGDAKAIAVNGNYAYVADGTYGVIVLNVSDKANPTKVGELLTSNSRNIFRRLDSFLFPVAFAMVGPSNEALDIIIYGSTAYVAHGTHMRILDLTIPIAPSLTGSYTPPAGGVYSVDVSGTNAFLACGSDGMRVVDISTPATPSLTTTAATAGSHSIRISGNYAFVADGATFKSFDISIPAAPVPAGSVATTSSNRVFLSGANAFVSDGTDGIRAMDISTPTAISQTGIYNSDGSVGGAAIIGSTVIAADGTNGVVALDGSNLAAMTPVGTLETISSGSTITKSGDYLFVGTSEILKIVDVSSPTSPRIVGKYTSANGINGIDVANNKAYLAGGANVEIVDVTNPTAPTLLGTYVSPGAAYAVKVVGNYAYVADFSSGLRIVNISNSASPVQSGFYDTSGWSVGIYVSGNYAYVADYNSGLQIIDVTNPAAPTLTGTYNTSGEAQDVYVNGSVAYVADGSSNNLTLLDVSSPVTPTLITHYSAGLASPGGLSGSGTNVCVIDSASLTCVNASVPASITRYDTASGVSGNKLVVEDGKAYVAAGSKGLMVISNIGF